MGHASHGLNIAIGTAFVKGFLWQVEGILKIQEINYLRNGEEKSVKVVPSEKPDKGKASLGIAMESVGTAQFPFYRAVWEGLKTTVRLISLTAKAIFQR